MSIWDGVATKEEKRILREIEGVRLPESRKVHADDGVDLMVDPNGDVIATVSNKEELERFHREMFERRISELEALVQRIATHLGIE